jgi:heptosyltransferase-1
VTGVLFVRLSAMGDLVHALGAIAALRRVRPEWRGVVVTQPQHAPLLDGAEGVDEVVRFERRGGLRAVWALRRALRTQRFDFVLDLQGNWKSAMVARLAPLARGGARLGMAVAWRQEPASRVLLGRTVAGSGPPHPAVAAWLLVRAIAPDAPWLLPRLAARPQEIDAERRVLAGLGVDAARPFTVVVVTDPADPRALRPEVVAGLVRDGACTGVPAVPLLGPAEHRLQASGPVLRHGAGEPRRLVALGALVAAAGGHVIGPDQGATHVLAAAGAQCRVLFGPQDPARTAPPAAQVLVHRAPPPCAPCRQRVCTHSAGPVCMAFPPDDGRAVALDLPPR